VNNSYTGIVDMMRNQAKAQNDSGVQLATMTGQNTCEIGTFPLTAEDLLISDRLLETSCTSVTVNGNEDKSTYSAALKKGDIVAIFKVSDTKYVILERVVSL